MFVDCSTRGDVSVLVLWSTLTAIIHLKKMMLWQFQFLCVTLSRASFVISDMISQDQATKKSFDMMHGFPQKNVERSSRYLLILWEGILSGQAAISSYLCEGWSYDPWTVHISSSGPSSARQAWPRWDLQYGSEWSIRSSTHWLVPCLDWFIVFQNSEDILAS